MHAENLLQETGWLSRTAEDWGAKHAGRRRTGRGDRRYAQVKESRKELHPGLDGREGLGEAEANRWREEEEAEG